MTTESKHWTGDDDRDLDHDYDADACEVCGAGALQDCEADCTCDACVIRIALTSQAQHARARE